MSPFMLAKSWPINIIFGSLLWTALKLHNWSDTFKSNFLSYASHLLFMHDNVMWHHHMCHKRKGCAQCVKCVTQLSHLLAERNFNQTKLDTFEISRRQNYDDKETFRGKLLLKFQFPCLKLTPIKGQTIMLAKLILPSIGLLFSY